MMDCQQLESALWAWQEEPLAHPSHHALQQHLEQCPACQASVARLQELKHALRGLGAEPDAGFEARLKSAIAGTVQPRAFEDDPFLAETSQSHVPQARIVNRQERAFWLRPLGLVAAGAVAAVCIGLLGQGTNKSQGPVAEQDPAPQVAPAPGVEQPAISTDEALREGVLAERKWEEDSSSASAKDLAQPEKLTPVTARP